MKGKIVARAMAAVGITVGSFFGANEWVKSGDDIESVDPDFRAAAEMIRYFRGDAIKINSGFRNKHYNAAIGGAKGSAHTKGLAADFSGKGSSDRYDLVRATMDLNYFLSAQEVLRCYMDSTMADSVALDIVQHDHYISRFGIARWGVHVDADPDKPQGVIWLY